MDYSDPASKRAKTEAGYVLPRKRRIVVAACGTVDAEKFGDVCRFFLLWAEVKAVVTKSSLRFIHEQSIFGDVDVFGEEHEWLSWKRIGDRVLHIELCKWADMMVIAPLSANTLGKIALGLCDNLLTCIVRAWDYKKPLFVAPSMSSSMWRNLCTEQHVITIEDIGINLIAPLTRISASGEYERGAMAEPANIFSHVRVFCEHQIQKNNFHQV